MGIADLEGQIVASAPETAEVFKVADRLWFQRAVQTRGFFVGEPVVGRISGRYSHVMSYPILDDRDRFQGVLTAAIDLDWLGSQLAKSDFPPTCAMVLTDSTRKVLFRYPEPLKYLGRRLPDFLIRAMTANDEGGAEGMGLPGDARLFAFARLSPPWQEMRVFLGLPRDWAVGKVNQDLRHNLVWLGLVAILALAAAWFGAGLVIVRPVRKLRHLTDQLAAGNLTVRAGPAYTGGAGAPGAGLRPHGRGAAGAGRRFSLRPRRNCSSGPRN